MEGSEQKGGTGLSRSDDADLGIENSNSIRTKLGISAIRTFLKKIHWEVPRIKSLQESVNQITDGA